MSFEDYLHVGQVIDFAFTQAGEGLRYGARVTSLDESSLVLEVTDSGAGRHTLEPGTKGTIWGKRGGLQYSLNVKIDHVDEAGLITLRHIPSRTHLRVDALVKMICRKISEEEFQSKRRKFALNMAAEADEFARSTKTLRGDDGEGAGSGVPGELMAEIQSIHRKLDFIIRQLGTHDEVNNIFTCEPVAVNISGSGLRFCGETRYTAGDMLDMTLLLPLASGVVVELVGQVMRCSEADGAGETPETPRYETAVKFLAVTEDDRECIIRYVFKRQRELLRAEDSAS